MKTRPIADINAEEAFRTALKHDVYHLVRRNSLMNRQRLFILVVNLWRS